MDIRAMVPLYFFLLLLLQQRGKHHLVVLGEKTVHRLIGGHIKHELLVPLASGGGSSSTSTVPTAPTHNNANHPIRFKAKNENEDDRKTLSQQIIDGKYGLIDNELFRRPIKRPGILSYDSNPEVPKDNINTFGGLTKNEIWLAENHLLVVKGGRLPTGYHPNFEGGDDSTDDWKPIDNYRAPSRPVKIPNKPKVPPPFPVQFSDTGPLQVLGTNLTDGTLYQLLSNNTQLLLPLTMANISTSHKVLIYPQSHQFIGSTGNGTNGMDDDDQSIYYPPAYSFHYDRGNVTSVVPPGPLVPGIILPPPPNFFQLLNDDSTTSTNRPKTSTIISTTTTSSTSSSTTAVPLIKLVKNTEPVTILKPVLKRPITHQQLFVHKKKIVKVPPAPVLIRPPPPPPKHQQPNEDLESNLIPNKGHQIVPSTTPPITYYEKYLFYNNENGPKDPQNVQYIVNRPKPQQEPQYIYVTSRPQKYHNNNNNNNHHPHQYHRNTFNVHIAKLRKHIQQFYTTPRTPRPLYQFSFEAANYHQTRHQQPTKYFDTQMVLTTSTTPPPIPHIVYPEKYYTTVPPPVVPKPISQYSFEISPPHQKPHPPPPPALLYQQQAHFYPPMNQSYHLTFGAKITAPHTTVPPPPPPVKYSPEALINYIHQNRPYFHPTMDYYQQQQQQQRVPPQIPNGNSNNNHHHQLIKSVPITTGEGQQGQFISYQLPGDNGAHFYFLTPQLAQKRKSY